MPRSNVNWAKLIVLTAVLLACQAGISQSSKKAPQYSPTTAVNPIRVSLVQELDRGILVLKQGLKEHWATRDQYLTAFEKTPGTDPNGPPLADAKSYVACVIGEHLPTDEVWDEKWDSRPPINVEVQRTIDELTKRREGLAVGFLISSCAAPVPRKVAVSAGVAASMLKTRVDPVYPPIVGSSPTHGAVVLHATISTKGVVETLSVISGPASLQQAAMDAVRHWTYRPYLLNNKPVEVETTINVAFLQGH